MIPPLEVAHFLSPGQVEPGNKYLLQEWSSGNEFWGRPKETIFDTYTEAIAEASLLSQFFPWCIGRISVIETRPKLGYSWTGKSNAGTP